MCDFTNKNKETDNFEKLFYDYPAATQLSGASKYSTKRNF
jgi:hypothetical protein